MCYTVFSIFGVSLVLPSSVVELFTGWCECFVHKANWCLWRVAHLCLICCSMVREESLYCWRGGYICGEVEITICIFSRHGWCMLPIVIFSLSWVYWFLAFIISTITYKMLLSSNSWPKPLNILNEFSYLSRNRIYISVLYAGPKCLCSEETMGRSILGFAAVKATRATAFFYNVWTCHGGNSCLLFLWPILLLLY